MLRNRLTEIWVCTWIVVGSWNSLVLRSYANRNSTSKVAGGSFADYQVQTLKRQGNIRERTYPDVQQDGAGPHGMESVVQLFCVRVSDLRQMSVNFPATLTNTANILSPGSVLATWIVKNIKQMRSWVIAKLAILGVDAIELEKRVILCWFLYVSLFTWPKIEVFRVQWKFPCSLTWN